jgi:hypothetical protein
LDSRFIPSEYRLFTQPGEIIKPLVKVEDVDIAAALVKLHALSGDNLHRISDNMKALSSEQHTNYLLYTCRRGVTLCPASDAYKRGNQVADIFSMAGNLSEKQPDIRLFAVSITDRDETGNGSIRGDLVELNGKAIRANIKHHSITPDKMDATFIGPNGNKPVSYDLFEWGSLTQNERSFLQDVTPHYRANDVRDVDINFSILINATGLGCKTVDIETVLSEINVHFMADAANPQPGMLRVTNEAAREILARGDMDVYKLTAEGPDKMAAFEALRPLCFREHRETAIKCEDAARLDIWANRTVKDIMRRNERDERNTNKTKGEEL